MKIVSGGQTGIDKIALIIAKMALIPTGGMAPKNWWTEKGRDLTLRDEFGLIEAPVIGYTYRTKYNALTSDATVMFGNILSRGSVQTLKFLKDKPHLINPEPEVLADWIRIHEYEIINVAGNRESVLTPEHRKFAIWSLYMAFSILGFKAQYDNIQARFE